MFQQEDMFFPFNLDDDHDTINQRFLNLNFDQNQLDHQIKINQDQHLGQGQCPDKGKKIKNFERKTNTFISKQVKILFMRKRKQFDIQDNHVMHKLKGVKKDQINIIYQNLITDENHGYIFRGLLRTIIEDQLERQTPAFYYQIRSQPLQVRTRYLRDYRNKLNDLRQRLINERE